jgi:acetyltransferase-like isoleucine patch superfamily enzyme/dTDP-4-dehydrorhamnose 3,5-epimerase-like enzyme
MMHIHSTALCDSNSIGDGARVGAFSRIARGATLGAACEIADHALVDDGAVVGDRTYVGAGVKLWQGVVLEDDVRVDADVAFVAPSHDASIRVQRGAAIGAHATIFAGVTIGVGARVEPAAVVTKSVPPHAIVSGNPARIVGYVDLIRRDALLVRPPAEQSAIIATDVKGVTLHEMLLVRDLRGDLSAGEFERNVPFAPRRYFVVFDVSSEDVRGEHAHRECRQFLVCVRGRCHVVVDDAEKRAEIVLDRPNLGLYIPPMVWGIQYKQSTDALLLVFASHYYDPDDYIRDYGRFIEAVAESRDRAR